MKIMTVLSAAVLAVAASLHAVAAPPAFAPPPNLGKVDLRVVGVSVAMPDPNDKFGQSMAKGLSGGTGVHFAIATPNNFLVAIDRESCKLAAFTDDKGAALAAAAAKAGEFGESWLGPWTEIDASGHLAKISIVSSKLPTRGAKAVSIKAIVGYISGIGSKNFEQKDVPLAKGAKITVGPVPMEIEQTSAANFDGPSLTVEFKSNKSFDAIRSLSFVGSDGKQIESSPSGSGSMGFAGNMTYTRAYSLKGSPQKATLKISCFERTEKIAIPIDVTVGVGL